MITRNGIRGHVGQLGTLVVLSIFQGAFIGVSEGA